MKLIIVPHWLKDQLGLLGKPVESLGTMDNGITHTLSIRDIAFYSFIVERSCDLFSKAITQDFQIVLPEKDGTVNWDTYYSHKREFQTLYGYDASLGALLSLCRGSTDDLVEATKPIETEPGQNILGFDVIGNVGETFFVSLKAIRFEEQLQCYDQVFAVLDKLHSSEKLVGLSIFTHYESILGLIAKTNVVKES